MKRAVTRELFAYWNSLRGANLAPRHDAVEPAAIRACLAETFVLTLDPARGHPFRLAGTTICTSFGRELKNRPFASLWKDTEVSAMLQLMQILASEPIVVVAGVTGENAQGDSADLETILLPLADEAGARTRIIGALGPCQPPYWIGFRPLQTLSITEIRFIGLAEEPVAPRRLVAGRDNPLKGRGFVCYPASHSAISRNYQG